MGCHCRIQYIPSMMMIVDVQECIIWWGIVKAFTTLAWIHLHLYHKSINLSTKMPRIRIWKSYECTYHILVNKFLKIDYEMKSSTTWHLILRINRCYIFIHNLCYKKCFMVYKKRDITYAYVLHNFGVRLLESFLYLHCFFIRIIRILIK